MQTVAQFVQSYDRALPLLWLIVCAGSKRVATWESYDSSRESSFFVLCVILIDA